MANNAVTTATQYANIDNKQIAYRKIGNGTPLFWQTVSGEQLIPGTLSFWIY